MKEITSLVEVNVHYFEAKTQWTIGSNKDTALPLPSYNENFCTVSKLTTYKYVSTETG